MGAALPRDEGLRPYATERQWEILEAYWSAGSESKAAKTLDCDKSLVGRMKQAVLKKAARQGYAPGHDLTYPAPDGLTLRGASLRRDGEGNVDQSWTLLKQEGRTDEEAIQLPDPKTIKRLATQRDAEGRVTTQWVREEPADIARVQAWEAFAEGAAKRVALADPIPAPLADNDDLMACYPIGDHHFGMMAWGKETLGPDYDLDIAKRLLKGSFDYLIDRAPPSRQAAIISLGDLLHFDGYVPETPASKHALDTDTRYPKMYEAVGECLTYAIDRALTKHLYVIVILEGGNHDPVSTISLRLYLKGVYRNEPRVQIDTSPALLHFIEFGRTMVMIHHGHNIKIKDLPLVMATADREMFARTDHHYVWTGHIHQDRVYEERGIRVESQRVLAPSDAWASSRGYLSGREMKVIILHREFGEDGRFNFTPRILRS